MKEQKVPELRFPEFKENWNSSFIGDHYSNLRTGMTPYRGKPEYYDGDIPWISSGELNYGYIFDTAEKITEEAVKETNLVVYPIGTFFIAITGLEAPGTRGKCAINGVPAATNQSCMAFREVEGLSTKFLFYWYHKYGVKLYFEYAQGTKQQSFNNKLVEIFPISHPEKPEQQKIASFLSSVDKKIEQLTRKKELLEEYKKGVMQKLFPSSTGSDSNKLQHPELRFKPAPSGVEGDENGEDFPDWEVKRLEQVSKMNPRSQELPEKFVYIDLESVEKGRLLKEEEIYLKDAPSRAQRYLSQGDILFQTVRPYQMNNYLFDNKGEYVASSGYAQIKPIGNRSFLFHYLHHQPIVNLIIRWSTGSSFPAISPSDLTQLPISFPNIKEQNLIAGFLDSLFKKINTVENEIEQTQTFKKGLLQQMFV